MVRLAQPCSHSSFSREDVPWPTEVRLVHLHYASGSLLPSWDSDRGGLVQMSIASVSVKMLAQHGKLSSFLSVSTRRWRTMLPLCLHALVFTQPFHTTNGAGNGLRG